MNIPDSLSEKLRAARIMLKSNFASCDFCQSGYDRLEAREESKATVEKLTNEKFAREIAYELDYKAHDYTLERELVRWDDVISLLSIGVSRRGVLRSVIRQEEAETLNMALNCR